MKGTMMDYPLTVVPILERAGRLFGKAQGLQRLGIERGGRVAALQGWADCATVLARPAGHPVFLRGLCLLDSQKLGQI